MLKELKNFLNIEDDLYILKKETRGIASKKSIKKGQIIISIPSKYLLTKKNMSYYEKIKGINQKNSIFAYFLYKESLKGKDSDWYFYIKTLPSRKSVSSDYPFFLKENVVQEIKKTEFGKRLKEFKNEIFDDYNKLKKYFREDIKWKIFIYFRLLVTSRIFGFNKILYMVPYIDLLNHSKEFNAEWYYKNDAFHLKALEEIKKNEEILISYGNESNLYLYLYYGFTLPRKRQTKNFLHLKNQNLNNILY